MKTIQVLLNNPCASAFLQLYLGIVLAVVVCVTGLFSYYQVRISSGRCGATVIVVVCVCVCLSITIVLLQNMTWFISDINSFSDTRGGKI